MSVPDEVRRDAERTGALVHKKLLEIMELQADIDTLLRGDQPTPFEELALRLPGSGRGGHPGRIEVRPLGTNSREIDRSVQRPGPLEGQPDQPQGWVGPRHSIGSADTQHPCRGRGLRDRASGREDSRRSDSGANAWRPLGWIGPGSSNQGYGGTDRLHPAHEVRGPGNRRHCKGNWTVSSDGLPDSGRAV
jgi:hypothetical protein